MSLEPLLVEVIGGTKLVLDLDPTKTIAELAGDVAAAVERSLVDEKGNDKAWRLFAPNGRGGFAPAKPDADLAKVAESMRKLRDSPKEGGFAGPGEHEGKTYLFRLRLFVPSKPPPKPVEAAAKPIEDEEAIDLTDLNVDADELETVRHRAVAKEEPKRRRKKRGGVAGSKTGKIRTVGADGHRRKKRRSTGEIPVQASKSGRIRTKSGASGEIPAGAGRSGRIRSKKRRSTGEIPAQAGKSGRIRKLGRNTGRVKTVSREGAPGDPEAAKDSGPTTLSPEQQVAPTAVMGKDALMAQIRASEAADAAGETLKEGMRAVDALEGRISEQARRAETSQQAEEAQRAAEARRVAEEAQRAAEVRRVAEEAQRAAEARRVAEEAQRAAEARRVAEELSAEKARRAELVRATAAAEAERAAEMDRVAAETRAAAAARAAANAEAQRLAEEARLAEEDAEDERRAGEDDELDAELDAMLREAGSMNAIINSARKLSPVAAAAEQAASGVPWDDDDDDDDNNPALVTDEIRGKVASTRVVARALDVPSPERGSQAMTGPIATQKEGWASGKPPGQAPEVPAGNAAPPPSASRSAPPAPSASRSAPPRPEPVAAPTEAATPVAAKSSTAPEGARRTSGGSKGKKKKKSSGMLGLIVVLLAVAVVAVGFAVVLLKDEGPTQPVENEVPTATQPQPAAPSRLSDMLSVTAWEHGGDPAVAEALGRYLALGVDTPKDAGREQTLGVVLEVAGELATMCDTNESFDACEASAQVAFAAWQGCRTFGCADPDAAALYAQAAGHAEASLGPLRALEAPAKTAGLKRLTVHSVRLAGFGMQQLTDAAPQLATVAQSACERSLASTPDCQDALSGQ